MVNAASGREMPLLESYGNGRGKTSPAGPRMSGRRLATRALANASFDTRGPAPRIVVFLLCRRDADVHDTPPWARTYPL